MANRDIIVMGASKGGVEAFSKLASLLPADFPGAVFIVQHSSPEFRSRLHEILSHKGRLPAIQPQDGDRIRPGVIHVAPRDRHLLVKTDHVETPFGPHENRSRSAAAFHTTRVVAVLLTGYLDDGVSGLSAVKRCGGFTIVQDPREADAPDMPENAIRHVAVDHVLSLEAIASRLSDIVREPAPDPIPVPEEIMEKIKVSEHEVPNIERMNRIGEVTPFTCPDCGGAMWNAKNEPVPRLVCHTGHSFTVKAYLEGQAKVIENSLWAAIRFMNERIKTLKDLVEMEQGKGALVTPGIYEERLRELDYHMRIIRKFIVSGGLSGTDAQREDARE